MSTILVLKTANNTDIRAKTDPNTINTDMIADKFDAVADELLARGIGVVDATSDLGTYDSADHITVLVKNYGIFIDATSGPANGNDIFAGVGGRFWTLVARVVTQVVGSGTYTPTSTDTNVASKTWGVAHYHRIGNEVHIQGYVLVAATSAGAVVMNFNPPIASNFGSSLDALGMVYDVDDVNTQRTIAANVGTTLRLGFTAPNTSSHVMRFTAIYTIL